MSESKALVRNTAWLFSSDILVNILAVILTIIIARILGDTNFGKYSFAFAFVGLFLITSDLGLGQLMIREIARDKSQTKKYFYNILGIKIFLLIITLVMPIFLTLILRETNEIIIIISLASLATVFLYISHFMRWLLQAYELMQYEALIKTIEKIIIFILAILALILESGVIGLLIAINIAYLISAIISISIVYFKIIQIKFSFDIKYWKSMIKASFPFWLGAVFFIIYFRIDTVMLTYMQDFDAVGWYNAAFKLVEGLLFIPTIFITATFPVMSRFFANNKKYLKELIANAVRYLLIIALPLAIGTTIIAPRIISFLYSEQFKPAGPALQILIWAEALLFINLFLGYALNSINKQNKFTMTTAICAVINVLFNLILIPKFSFKGAAIATVVTQIISFILLYYFLSKEYRFNLKIIIQPVIASTIMGFILYQFKSIAIWYSVPLAMIVYFICLVLIKGIHKEDFKLLEYILPKRFLGIPQTEEK